MRWKLFATFAETAGENELTFDLEGEQPTVRDALDALLAAQPALEDELLDESGALYDHVGLLHEGTNPFQNGEGWDTPVGPDDELALFPPVSGGR